jgi:hypothetical protein
MTNRQRLTLLDGNLNAYISIKKNNEGSATYTLMRIPMALGSTSQPWFRTSNNGAYSNGLTFGESENVLYDYTRNEGAAVLTRVSLSPLNGSPTFEWLRKGVIGNEQYSIATCQSLNSSISAVFTAALSCNVSCLVRLRFIQVNIGIGTVVSEQNFQHAAGRNPNLSNKICLHGAYIRNVN